jgi:hypothetical protein
MKLLWLFSAVLFNFSIFAQSIPAERLTNWSYASNVNLDTSNFEFVSALDLGLIADGITDNSPTLNSFLNSPLSARKTVYFPSGIYSFHSTIFPNDSVILKGERSDSTIFIFDLNGAGNAIHLSGTRENQPYTLLQDAVVFQNYLLIENASDFSPFSWIEISQDDSQWITSSWALGSVSQQVQISHVAGDTLFLFSELRHTYSTINNAKIFKVYPKTHVGFECIGMERIDNTAPQQTSTLFMNYSNQCWAKGLALNKCTFGHIELSHCSQITIQNCYIHHAHEYGDGGRGYGVVLHFGTGECLVENNVFEHLRHSVLLQAGANGNVVSYNYSYDPFWSTSSVFIPSNSAGELVLHGNYVYRNLFEMNSVQNIVIDNSHGPNGPYNTFLRNRASLFGIFFSADNSPSQNFIGNEIPNTEFPFSSVNYMLLGSDHFLYGNNNKGTIDPIGSENTTLVSLAYSNSPDFLAPQSLGLIGPPLAMNSYEIPAEHRTLNNQPLAGTCNLELVLAQIEQHGMDLQVYPNPFSRALQISSPTYIDCVRVYDSTSQLVLSKQNIGNQFKLDGTDLKNGAYYLQVETKIGCSFVKVIKIQ